MEEFQGPIIINEASRFMNIFKVSFNIPLHCQFFSVLTDAVTSFNFYFYSHNTETNAFLYYASMPFSDDSNKPGRTLALL